MSPWARSTKSTSPSRSPARRKKSELKKLGRRLAQLRLTLGGLIGQRQLGPPLFVAFEGWDAGGKGGAIKRLVAPLDPRHVRVAQFSAPDADEKRHHFLHRFWAPLPGWGGMSVYDRTWYGRVLVERVEGYATRGGVGARLRGDRRLRAQRGRRGLDPGQVLAPHLRRGAAEALRGARRGPAEEPGS